MAGDAAAPGEKPTAWVAAITSAAVGAVAPLCTATQRALTFATNTLRSVTMPALASLMVGPDTTPAVKSTLLLTTPCAPISAAQYASYDVPDDNPVLYVTEYATPALAIVLGVELDDACSTCVAVGAAVLSASTTQRALALALNVVASVTDVAPTAVAAVCDAMPTVKRSLKLSTLDCAQYASYVVPSMSAP